MTQPPEGFGSGDLTPDLVRGAVFHDVGDGRYDAQEVREFLEQVASALEVVFSHDLASAMRRELQRNADIAERVLGAGQQAAERLRQQAAEDARRMLDETRIAAEELQAAVHRDIDQSRTQVDQVRAQFIGDMRDLYDRIGASLYRFERAASDSESLQHVESIAAPSPSPAPSPAASTEAATHVPAPEAPAAPEAVVAAPDEPAQHLAPAWTQLHQTAPDDDPAPTPASQAAPESPAEPSTNPFAPVVEDEPLAEGEPLIDLSAGFDDESGDDASAMPAAEPESDWLSLDPVSEPDPAGEDQRAEQLLAGIDDVLEAAPHPMPAHEPDLTSDAMPTPTPTSTPAPTPTPSSEHEAPAAASPDAMAVRNLVLQAVADGQPRASIEAYLRDHLGMLEPGLIIDAALSEAQVPPPPQ